MAYGQFVAPAQSFNRATGTTQYSQLELIAQSATAANCTPMKFDVSNIRGRGKIVAVRVFSDNEAVTNAIFAVHLFRTDPGVPTNGDNGGFAVASVRDLLATVACNMSSGSTVSSTDKMQRFALSTPIVFQIPAEARFLYAWLATGSSGTYTPADSELFEVTLEIEGVN